MNKIPDQLTDLTLVVDQTNSLAIPDKKRAALVATLKPIASRIMANVNYAETLTIVSPEDAKKAATYRDGILKDIDDADNALGGFDQDENGTGIIERLFRLHRGWTGFRSKLKLGNEGAAKLIKMKIGDFEEKQEQAAEAERQRLQAIADETARREVEAAEKKAAAAVKPETKQKYEEKAAAVFAPVIQVPVEKSGVGFQKRWSINRVDKAMLVAAAAKEPALCNYLKVDEAALLKSKIANPLQEFPGVHFQKVRV